MHIPIILAFVVLQCTLCLSIRVPVDWGDDSVVNRQLIGKEDEDTDEKLTQNDYFHYPAKKPQFAIEIAANSGNPSPENYYKSHPIEPNTGLIQHKFQEQRVQEPQKNSPSPHEGAVQNIGSINYAKPATTSFEILHPYKSEEPALQQLYKDPIFENIRYGLRDSNRKLQKYQNEAGQTDVTKDEYLESPEQIDRKKQPQKNVPAQFEIHRPQRRPVYYRYPPNPNHRENILNQKLRLPWNQNIGKVTPIHYRPLKNHLYGLRQQHALKYDDEGNEYPQLLPEKDSEDKPEGYDIYEKGNAKFVQFKGQVDDAINRVEDNKKPRDEHKQDSLKQEEDHNNSSDDEEEFVPIKNYAQVRKTEITKHLPREAAIEDAESLEELQNAPRLREAIKSKKAQIVYSEEGYEDSAYDHGKEQKHASDHERHGGYLKKNEISNGKYKTPSYNSNYTNTKGSKSRNQIEHGEKWDSDIKENEDENDSDYYESKEGSENSNMRQEESSEDEYNRNKRNSENNYNKSLDDNLNNENNPDNDVIKRKTVVDIPQKNTNSAIISTNGKNNNIKSKTVFGDSTNIKYPYYFRNLNILSKNSPIRYAENFDLIPKKSKGGTEFYDSRSALQCPEVEDNVDPLPEKLKKNGHPDDVDSDLPNNNTKEVDKFKSLKNTQRLKGLGDKIDCFKAKYFGQNPLDSPFFEEDIIENPEPVTKPSFDVFNTRKLNKLMEDKSITQNSDLFSVLQKLRRNQSEISSTSSYSSPNITLREQFLDLKTNVTDIPSIDSQNRHKSSLNITSILDTDNKKYTEVRRKRATPFTYEPYKIIRDSQIPDSRKTTTTGNISPLIKQLQSSRVIDKVTIIQDKEQSNKKNNTRAYKDIGKNERQDDQTNNKSILSIVDVNTDQRRGEPRYEIRPANHKSQYSPVETKKAISIADYKAHSKNDFNEKKSRHVESTTQTQLKRSKRRKPTTRPFFDVSKYLPKPIDTEQNSASSTVKKIILATTLDPPRDRPQRQKLKQLNIKDNKYDDYENDDEEDNITPTSTTLKAKIRKRIRGTTSTTTSRPVSVEDKSTTSKLHLHTRFREYPNQAKTIPIYTDSTEKPLEEIYETGENTPKYLEKKKKSSKSTLVTDTKSYGEDDDDDDEDERKKEVDELIGVQHDMDDYLPLYERVVNKINRMKNENLNKKREHVFDNDAYSDNINKDKYIIQDDDDDDDDNDGDDDEEDDDSDSYKYNNDDDDEDEEEENDENESERENFDKKSHSEATTSEPTKRTLVKTTEAPITTTESRSLKSELKPMVIKKKIDIHKEIPVNKTSPHVTQFKQDIKEIEIIKEMSPISKKNLNKNIEALDFYRDENLAEEINKLSDVEVFRENLDLKSGPRHGGNYRSITPEELEREKSSLSKTHNIKNKADVETSQSEVRELVQLGDPLREAGSYSTRSGTKVNNEGRNAKLIELRDTTSKPRLHGGNLKLSQGTEQRRKSEKYVDIDDEEDEETTDMHGGNFKSYGNSRNTGRQMHGGNYRSAKLVKSEGSEEKQQQSRRKSKNNSISTTTPIYILDPSKRMYYYVDA